ncbi:Protein YIM1 [Pseudozyma hubeiensis]|nr:Protein YIM1 [Pseudozyma hubeiensis]
MSGYSASRSEDMAQVWRVHKKGLPPVTMQLDTVAIPEPKQGEVLVKVHSAAVNPVEWKIAAHAPAFIQRFPRGMGTDFSGTVLRTGPGLTSEELELYKPGTSVIGMVPVEVSLKNGQGALGTHVCVGVKQLGAVPPSLEGQLSLQDAAGLPLVGTTALALVRRARAGDKVLVCGGSTSVGLVLLQLLKAEGAGCVVATASGPKKETVKALGADEVIDFRENDVVQTLRRDHSAKPFDLILDTVGDFAVFRACPAYLKESGEYANVGASDMRPDGSIWSILNFLRNMTSIFLPWWLGGVPRKSTPGGSIRDGLPEFIDKYLVNKSVRCPVDSTFDFRDAPKAYERLMTGRALGKIIVDVD